MPNLKKMKRMNYAEAWTFFMENKRMGAPEAIDYLKYISRKTFVDDIRGKAIPFDELYKGGWLIVVDGVSCSGKTTTAKKIAEQFPETVEIIDIDYLFGAWLQREAEKIPNKEERKFFVKIAEKKGDEYLKLNLEKLVENRAKEGKTIILVGCFLETIYRAVVGTVLGKYFEKVAILTIYEEMETVNKYIENRENTFGNPGGTLLAKQISETSKQISFLKRVIDTQLFVLGFGADKSFIINNETKLY